MKKYLFGSIFAAILAAAAIWWFRREPALVALQKQYLFAKTEEEKSKVIDRLEKYYLNLDVPPALNDSIDHDFARLLKKTTIDLSAYTNGKAGDKNPYALENDLRSLVRNTLVTQARNESETFRQLMNYAHKMATVVDAGTQNNYWTLFVERISLFSKTQAVAWLNADLAQARCRTYQDSESRFRDAEFYASLGLKFLQQENDERIRLDLIQRLQFILYEYLSMYELSLGLGEKLLPQADTIKYHLRSNGIIYHQAQALARMGQNQAAVALYDEVIDRAENLKKIADMQFFTIHGLLGKGERCLELGEFEKSFEICNKVTTKELTPRDNIRLRNLRWDALRSTANYEQAEEELKKAIANATATKDTFHLATCLNNLGVMFERLSEYDLAFDYYNQARSLLNASSVPYIERRLLVLNNIADLAATKNDSAQFEEITQEATRLRKFALIPSVEAQLLQNIGNLHKKAGQYEAAIKYLEEASVIYDRNGIVRYDLGARIDLVDCLINLSRFVEAKTQLRKIESLAKEINDIERVIEVHGRLIKIQYREGHLAEAVKSSQMVLHEIEEMSSYFKSVDRLMAYRQKIYDLLKDAIFCEIVFNRQDSAFIKLDHAKAYALKSQFDNQSNHATPHKYLNLDSVRANLIEKSLLIDYMVTSDTLYAFVLERGGLKLLRKSIKIELLRKAVAAYKDSIGRTINVFQHYDIRKASSHYAGTTAIGQKLYEYLLGWTELEFRLYQANILYIVPDEFLHELPFSTLLAKSSDANNFVANHAAIMTLPSAGFLHDADKTQLSNQLKNKKVLVSADRRFPGSEKFVSKLKTLFPKTEELMSKDSVFTKDDILAKLKEGYQIYIFVGHSAADQKHPDHGYIELAVKTPAASKAKTVRLLMSDLKSINWLGAEMVMLVGCETASGKLYRGTGISGLQQGFLFLGTQNVLGNLWEVDARLAIAQAEDFLTFWVTTLNPSQALQACQLQAIQSLQGNSYYKHPHPYFWGSSILFTAKHE